MDSVLRNKIAGGMIRKTETNVFEILRDLSFRPAGGCGRNAGRIFRRAIDIDFLEDIMVLLYYE